MKKLKWYQSIQTKMFIGVLIIVLGITLASLTIFYYAEENTIEATTERYMTQYISFADENLSDMLTEIEQISLSVGTHEEIIQQVVNLNNTEPSLSAFYLKKRTRNYLSALMSQKDEIDNILIVTNDQRIYPATQDIIMQRDLQTPIIQDALNSTHAGFFFDEEGHNALYTRPIISAGEKAGSILLQLNYDVLISPFLIEPLQDVTILIFSKDSKLFYTNGTIDPMSVSPNIWMENKENSGYIEIDGERYYYVCDEHQKKSMSTISLMSVEVLRQDAADLRQLIFDVGLSAVICAFAVSTILSRMICKNINRLSQTMQNIQDGKLMVKSDIRSGDEVGNLANTFNQMMDRIRTLVEEVRINEKQKHEAEQSVLATQIEPHFLYNTINSIQYVAHMKNEKEIEQVASALTELVRSVLSNHNEFITLWEEKDYIENYMTIERFKYRTDFQLIWNVEEELWAYKIPKLLLQPVVENALLHGISGMPQGGMIEVKAFRSDENVLIQIIDNGQGMSREKIDELMNASQRTDKAGFRRVGFANVVDRIHLIYGKNGSVHISSYEGIYTSIELRLPFKGIENGNFSITRG